MTPKNDTDEWWIHEESYLTCSSSELAARETWWGAWRCGIACCGADDCCWGWGACCGWRGGPLNLGLIRGRKTGDKIPGRSDRSMRNWSTHRAIRHRIRRLAETRSRVWSRRVAGAHSRRKTTHVGRPLGHWLSMLRNLGIARLSTPARVLKQTFSFVSGTHWLILVGKVTNKLSTKTR